MDHEARIKRVRESLSANDAEALLVTDLANVRYLTGFSGSNGQVLITDVEALFMSDARYAARAADMVQGAEVLIYAHRMSDALRERLDGVSRVGIEATNLSVASLGSLTERLDGVELVPTKSLVENLRRTKDQEEVALLREAIRIGDEGFSWVLSRLIEGATEREVALDLEVHLRSSGAEAVSFEPIVGSGPLSAHIHHTPSERALQRGDIVLMDFGCRFEGYCSDLTRTVVLGGASDEQRETYELVLRAQKEGIAAAKAGAGTEDVDVAARSLIKGAGHGDEFPHSLGHGVGLHIHEAPRLGKSPEEDLDARALKAHDVVTIEPGVYLNGKFGVRIEDCVLVTEQGCEVLGSAPKDDLLEV
ncbi:MAG: Xaa-Pro peptidase family protein [Actinomycetota bacterium]|nr:Xaa-Pro peptidase family protein [Actinomycetota bacterium]